MKHKAPIVVIVAAALIPRLLHLNAFLTLDEFLWLDRSRNFLLALLGHDWATTFQTGHPGVTTCGSAAWVCGGMVSARD